MAEADSMAAPELSAADAEIEECNHVCHIVLHCCDSLWI